MVKKQHGLGNQQPSALKGEGSTTREQSRRAQESPKCPETVSTCKTCGEEKPHKEFYFHKSTGKPRAHCKKCLYRHQRQYAKSKPEVVREVSAAAARRYRKKHPHLIRASFRKWRENNEEYARKRCADWRQDNPGSVNHYKAKRRALTKKATPAWANMEKIVAIYSIARETGKVVDHIVPLKGKTVCGLHVENNLQLLTRIQNARKYNKLITA